VRALPLHRREHGLVADGAGARSENQDDRTAEIDTGLISAADFTEHIIGTNYLDAQKLHDFVTRRDGSLKRISKEQYEREDAPGN
jgi:hypothetical protein